MEGVEVLGLVHRQVYSPSPGTSSLIKSAVEVSQQVHIVAVSSDSVLALCCVLTVHVVPQIFQCVSSINSQFPNVLFYLNSVHIITGTLTELPLTHSTSLSFPPSLIISIRSVFAPEKETNFPSAAKDLAEAC